MPKVYRASTTILVMRQSIPEGHRHTTVTTRVEERIRSLKIQVKSRRYLEQVATELGPWPANATDGDTRASACSRLSNNVDLDWDRQGLSWFNIMVEDGNSKRAADIANRLARARSSSRTPALREAQAKGDRRDGRGMARPDRKRAASKRDADLARYRAQNLYELPDQQPATLQLLNAAQTRIQQLTSDIQLRSEGLATARARTRPGAAEAGGS